jgi:dynein heavy chain
MGSPKKARDEAIQRQQLLELLSKTEAGNVQGRPDVLMQIEHRKMEETAHRKRREKEMFILDPTPMDTYALPGKPEAKALIPHDNRNLKGRTNRKMKTVEVSSDDMDGKSTGDEFGFLSQALGTSRVLSAKVDSGNALNAAPGGGMPSRTGATSARQTSDLDEISHIMAGLKTGEDALNFFARYGSDTPVKFVNLLPVDDPKNYRPYDLVVSQSLGESDFEALVEHYTMSSAGIVHVCPGQPSECIPLTSWMRQGMIFKILRNIRFYKLFLHRKTFNIWKENVRFQLYAKQRKKIADRLYLTRKSSSAAIQTIKRHLMDMQNVKMLQLDLKTTDKNTFVEQQVAQCTKASTQFEEAMKQIIVETQQVISEVNNLHAQANLDPDANAGPYNDNAVPEKAKSLVKIKQEKIDRKLARQKAYIEFQGLPDFVRFVDYLTVETLVSLAVLTVENFHEVFVKVDEKGRKTGIFETYIRFASVGTSFTPTREDIREALEGLLDTMINTVGNINRVGYLTTGAKNIPTVGANIQHMVRESRRFRQMAESIQERVITDFAAADEHAKTFDTIRPIFDFNLTWDFEAYKAEQHDIQDIKDMFDRISNWNKELDKLRNKPIGVLEVDSKRLKV